MPGPASSKCSCRPSPARSETSTSSADRDFAPPKTHPELRFNRTTKLEPISFDRSSTQSISRDATQKSWPLPDGSGRGKILIATGPISRVRTTGFNEPAVIRIGVAP